MYMTATLPRSARPALSLAWFTRCYLMARTRAQLAKLDDAQLEDLGLSAQDAAREAARPFWA
ncbi:DUF1127 domain-containing protein [Pontivivens insulae]|uniref:YjiS-like domain-containing protein n=1 Tax=Pontivivens insulae TaxID=1639689 RepID=A0A2R8AC05_9RHOB|nr:DUF1127 domain-containing protein [Pontivivens insulae]RED11061.1 uncharacterized protein YjiS (DUF1127 family) [Pontivivens insulae]SPF29764.1 hypothetical protein POI8812_02081 [Pontivivens insulae]